jgi:hypothetical protein
MSLRATAEVESSNVILQEKLYSLVNMGTYGRNMTLKWEKRFSHGAE